MRNDQQSTQATTVHAEGSPATAAAEAPPYVNYAAVARCFGIGFAADLAAYPPKTREFLIIRTCQSIQVARGRREIVCNPDGLIADVRTR